MRLSTKHTTIYLVVATWADGKFKAASFTSERESEDAGKGFRQFYPDALVQVHRIEQALPEEEK